MSDKTKLNDNYNERNFINKLVDAVPNWAIGSIGTLLTLALVLKIVGIDFANPINSYTQAQVEIIKQQAMQKGVSLAQMSAQIIAVMSQSKQPAQANNVC